MTIPFGVVEGLIAPHLAKVKPVPFEIPNLGKLSDYFGDLTVVPQQVTLLPAAPDHIGFHLDFDVRRNGKRVFGMYMETEIKPDIDIAAGKINIGFTPDTLQKAKPGLSQDAADNLAGIIYDQIPALARLVISKAMVTGVVDTALTRLVKRFYATAKERMLPALSKLSRMEITLPTLPLAKVKITSTKANGGQVTLGVTTSLPVESDLAKANEGNASSSRDHISLRLTADTAAEVVNWAMQNGLVPDRYNDKGKPQKDGAFRPGLDWVLGEERPMKVFLWDLEKPCMRLTLSAKPSVSVVKNKLVIKAEDAQNEDIEASAFTKVGTWFYLLWKDPMNLNQKRNTKVKLVLAGQALEATLKAASLKGDVFNFDIRLSTKQ